MSKENETLLSKYISDNNSICREERQYALYLYNALKAYHDGNKNSDIVKIVEIIFAGKEGADGRYNDSLVIDNVFYEATFMRDLFEYNRRLHFIKKPKNRNKKNDDIYKVKNPDVDEYNNVDNFQNKSFNYRLFEYLSKEHQKDYKPENIIDITMNKLKALTKEYHLGQYTRFADDKNSKKENEYSIIDDMKSMMNAKPDIAVIYHKKMEDKKYLLFLECKFESGESKDGSRPQTELQYMIADFLCSSYMKINDMKFGCEVSPLMKKKSLKVEFYRYEPENENNNQGLSKDDDGNVKINIEKLININIK